MGLGISQELMVSCLTSWQRLGHANPFVEVGKSGRGGGGEGEEEKAVHCNVIMMGYGEAGRERMRRSVMRGVGTELTAGEEEEKGQDRMVTGLEEEQQEEGLGFLRSALKASRKHRGSGYDDYDDDDDKGDNCKDQTICAAEAAEELKGLGVEELARRLSALHAAADGLEQRPAASGIGTTAYFNSIRSSRCEPTNPASPLIALGRIVEYLLDSPA